MALNRSSQPPYEYACHEGNHALPGILEEAGGSSLREDIEANLAEARALRDRLAALANRMTLPPPQAPL